MIKFWSYNREFERYKKKIFSKIKKSLKSGQIFFGNELFEFEKNSLLDINPNTVLLLVVGRMH